MATPNLVIAWKQLAELSNLMLAAPFRDRRVGRQSLPDNMRPRQLYSQTFKSPAAKRN